MTGHTRRHTTDTESESESESEFYLFELVCSAHEKCTLYDASTGTSWWNHVDGKSQHSLAIVNELTRDIAAHRQICKGLMTVAVLQHPPIAFEEGFTA